MRFIFVCCEVYEHCECSVISHVKLIAVLAVTSSMGFKLSIDGSSEVVDVTWNFSWRRFPAEPLGLGY